MRRDEPDQQSVALYNTAREGGDKQEGHRGGSGMRKSAVSLRSGAGMPVHMAEGGEGGDVYEKEGKRPYVTSFYLGGDTAHASLVSVVYFYNTLPIKIHIDSLTNTNI